MLFLALRDQSGVVECAYVRSCAVPNLTYFATPLKLGPAGIQKHLGVPPLSDSESKLVEIAIPILKKSIRRGQVIFIYFTKNVQSSKFCKILKIFLCCQIMFLYLVNQYTNTPYPATYTTPFSM